jgi:hypothetical protein
MCACMQDVKARWLLAGSVYECVCMCVCVCMCISCVPMRLLLCVHIYS